MNKLPKARTAEIVVQHLNGEILIYDLTTDQAFCLNETAAKVFNACDGRTSFDRLRAEHHLTDEIVFLALDGLQKQNLLAGSYTSPFAGMSRREVIRKVGLASLIALPVISMIVAPAAVNAASGGFPPNSRGLTETCNNPSECMSSAPKCTGSTNGNSAPRTCCVPGTDSTVYPPGGIYLYGGTSADCADLAPHYCCTGRGSYTSGTCVCATS